MALQSPAAFGITPSQFSGPDFSIGQNVFITF